MCLSLLYILFVVPTVVICNVREPIDPETLHNVFGYPQPSPAGAASSPQFVAVLPNNGTLVDPDYWDSDDYTPAVSDYDKFDWSLTKHVASSTNDNFLLSPLGLKLALAILTEAATGNTQAELSNVLGFDLDRTAVRRKFSSIIESLEHKSTQYILNLGNRIYVDNIVKPRQRFAAIAQEFYKTELKKIDFDLGAQAVSEINSWVANKTDGHILNLVNEDDITGMVVLILNTLYFKGTWRHQFAPNATKLGPFYVSPSVQKQVPFMNIKDQFYYSESTKYDAKILRMPYLGNKFAMYIIVPNSLTGLPRILNALSDLRSELNYLRREQLVDVTLPKFKFDYTSLLNGVLKELGIRQAFEDIASFPGIARGQSLLQRLRVSRVLQKSGIEVNELGSIAYSATEISLVNKFGEDTESHEVIANKPFLFFIQDEVTRQLLFTGRVSDPSLENGTFKRP